MRKYAGASAFLVDACYLTKRGRTHLLRAQMVGPGDGNVEPGDDVFVMLVVKVAILHDIKTATGE
jgi:hypothetical protein